LTIIAFAGICAVSPRTVWQWISEGRLTPVRLGRRATRIEAAEAQRFIAEAKARSAR
jgi:hypothetical protein